MMLATEGIAEFLQLVTGFNINEFLTRLEGYSTSGVKGAASAHTASVTQLRQQVTQVILTNLRIQITGKKDIRMRWGDAYWHKIVQPLRVMIRSWPAHIPFACVSKSCSSFGNLNALLRAWSEGTTYWVKLTDSEFAEEERKRARDIRAGILPPDKLRKTRADKGKKRRRADHDEDDTNYIDAESHGTIETTRNEKRRRIEGTEGRVGRECAQENTLSLSGGHQSSERSNSSPHLHPATSQLPAEGAAEERLGVRCTSQDLTPENTLSLPGRPQVSQHDDTTASLYPPTNVTSRGTEESFLSPRWTDDAPCQARTTAGTSEPFQFGSGLGGHRSLMEELYGDTGEYPAGALFSC
ncbi:hypothetical protein BGW80DRAFT_1417098 [Lactifluus volemus]|nr:hypothetical protein BGW80DRAFT_1417098 [Lactifluus volemus]